MAPDCCISNNSAKSLPSQFLVNAPIGNNFVANFVWTRKKKGSFLSDKVRKMSEFIICYSNIIIFYNKTHTDTPVPVVPE